MQFFFDTDSIVQETRQGSLCSKLFSVDDLPTPREVMTNDDTVGEAFENQETRWSEIVDDNVTLGVNTTISWEIFRARMK